MNYRLITREAYIRNMALMFGLFITEDIEKWVKDNEDLSLTEVEYLISESCCTPTEEDFIY